MNSESPVQQFLEAISESIEAKRFVKLSLSKATAKQSDLKNIYARWIELKGEAQLSFTYRYTTNDQVKNYPIAEALKILASYLGDQFLQAHLFTTAQDLSLLFNKKRKARLLTKAATHHEVGTQTHNRAKKRNIEAQANPYLYELGISDRDGKVLKRGQKKFKQINKYIELIEHAIEGSGLPNDPHIVDMGSGKGYLTFALYDYLKNHREYAPKITGIELRTGLVEFCQNLAEKVEYEQLHFLAKDINDFKPERIDMLIALHACDIATDIAIAKGIKAGAALIMVAPCCHKQIRKQLDRKDAWQGILRHGILAERQAELITDGLRALLLEAHGYRTKVFEFISSEHTSKNLMIVGKKDQPNLAAKAKIAAIKAEFGIAYHHLETLL